jgi:hypothetical protein
MDLLKKVLMDLMSSSHSYLDDLFQPVSLLNMLHKVCLLSKKTSVSPNTCSPFKRL